MQRDDGIFISQDKYVADILKKFDFVIIKTTSTLIDTNKALLKDEEAEEVDVHLYRSMIGSLMCLTASRPNIMFAVCACVRFQVTPKVSHLHAVKRIFRYLKGQPKLGLWYPRDSPFNLEAFLDSDYAGASLDRKSTTGGCQFLGKRCYGFKSKCFDYGFNFMNTKIYIDNESTIYETVIKEWEDRMERATTTASSLEAEQDSGNINRTQSMATLNESFPQGADSGSGPRCQNTILRGGGGVEAQTRFEVAFKQSNDPPLSRVNTLRSGKDNMKLKELMEFCTQLSELSMRMEQYLTHTDYALWEVIVNGDAPAIASACAGTEGLIPPKTAEQKLARKNELKAKSTMLLAIPDEHLLKFHGIKDAKTLWEAIKARFRGNKESKKMIQKLISQLEIHGKVISQEDENLKLLRSLPLAWNNIALIMRNKSDLDTLSMDDLYNNLKVYEFEIKGQSSSNSQNVAFLSSENTCSTNEAVNTAHEVSTANLEQIDTDDLEEMDLKWQVAMLTMRVKRFLKKTGKNLNLNGKETVGFDKTNVECYNCHRRGHFARKCRAPRNQGNRNRDAPRRVVLVETPANTLVVQDGIGGYDWSFQAEEGITNFALMAYTSQGSSSSSSYQIGLESLEARIVVHVKTEAVYEEDIAFLNRESNVENSHVNDRFKKGEGFHAVPPPYTGNYIPSKLDLSFVGLDDFVYKTKVSETETSISKASKDIVEKPKTVRPNAPIIEDWDTDSDNDSEFRPKTDQTKPMFTKINFVKSDENVKSVNKENTHKQVEYPKKSQSPRGNRRNLNGMMTQKLGNGFEFIKKACFVCGSFNHLIKDCDFHDNKMVEKPVLNNKGRVTEVATKLGQVLVNVAKQNSPRAATSISTARPVNNASPKSKVNDALPKTYSYFKAHSPLVLLWDMGKMLLSPQHAGFGDQQEMLLTIPPKTVDHTCLKDLTMLIYKADSRSPKGGKITGKGKIRTGKLDFEDVYFVKELKFNLFSVSQMCDKKNSVLFTETECLVLSPDFKLLDESQVLLKVPRQNNV
ncbi:ribonuclease H-like domain-containing protein [Tanacetum coccineum]|uniref:Ribonuclease H-like domain-containing protein n=1 Tax=Tanacetum coccineum TaxID=301880 RepID=A0ABQ5DQB4_9ASTR